MQFTVIPKYSTLKWTISLGLGKLVGYDNVGVLSIPQSFRTGASPSDGLCHIHDIRWGWDCLTADIQSAYSTVPTEWTLQGIWDQSIDCTSAPAKHFSPTHDILFFTATCCLVTLHFNLMQVIASDDLGVITYHSNQMTRHFFDSVLSELTLHAKL